MSHDETHRRRTEGTIYRENGPRLPGGPEIDVVNGFVGDGAPGGWIFMRETLARWDDGNDYGRIMTPP